MTQSFISQADSGRGEKKRPFPSARSAFVTLLMLNDSYLPGALLLAYRLRQMAVPADLICLVTAEITLAARQALRQLFDAVIQVEQIFVPHARAGKRHYLPYVFTKLQALRLGADGDLGFAYDKVIILDADLLPLRRFADLLALPAPAGVMNEKKAHLVAACNGRFLLPDSVYQDGTWEWHRHYAHCGHGQPIPRCLTDRVEQDAANMGVNGSLLVIRPSLAEYHAIRQDLQQPATRQLVSHQFDWPEMQYLTLRWSGQWTNVDARYSGLNGYPCLDVLYGTHFAGVKPWYHSQAAALSRYGRYPDYCYWFQQYDEMVTRHHPRLRRLTRLQRLWHKARLVLETAV